MLLKALPKIHNQMKEKVNNIRDMDILLKKINTWLLWLTFSLDRISFLLYTSDIHSQLYSGVINMFIHSFIQYSSIYWEPCMSQALFRNEGCREEVKQAPNKKNVSTASCVNGDGWPVAKKCLFHFSYQHTLTALAMDQNGEWPFLFSLFPLWKFRLFSGSQ